MTLEKAEPSRKISARLLIDVETFLSGTTDNIRNRIAFLEVFPCDDEVRLNKMILTMQLFSQLIMVPFPYIVQRYV